MLCFFSSPSPESDFVGGHPTLIGIINLKIKGKQHFKHVQTIHKSRNCFLKLHETSEFSTCLQQDTWWKSTPTHIVDHEHHEGHYEVKRGLNALPSQKHIKVLDR